MISEPDQLDLLPEGAVRILVSADPDTIKARFKARMRSVLSTPVEWMLESKHDERYFRDYLNEHPDVAKEYESLKLRLWKQYEHNRDAYTKTKTDFISKWTAEDRKEFGDRY